MEFKRCLLASCFISEGGLQCERVEQLYQKDTNENYRYCRNGCYNKEKRSINKKEHFIPGQPT